MNKFIFLMLLISCSVFAAQEAPESESITQEEVYDFIDSLSYWVPKREQSVDWPVGR